MSTKSLLIISLLANLALAAVVGSQLQKKSEPAVANQESMAAAKVAAAKTKAGTEEKSAANVSTNAPAHKFDWQMVESADYKEYIANLRAIGCPEETIRDIIVADVNKLFDSRKKQLKAASTNRYEYWKSSSMFGNMLDEEKIKQKQQLADEKKEVLTSLLSAAPAEKPDMAKLVNPFEDMLDFLSDDKQAKVMDLLQSYQAKALKAMKGGTPDAEDMKAMQQVQKDMEAELGKVLTPDELQAYQLRLSQTAMMMRMQMASFDPNEKEFLDIFKLRKQFDDQYGVMGMGGDTDTPAYKAAKKQLDDQIKQDLGAQRYTEYERSQDYNYQTLAKIVDRQGLPKEVAGQVYDMKKQAEDAAGKVRADESLTADQRKAALLAIRTETETSMTGALGETGFKSYSKQAWWLKSISPDPKKPK